MFLLVVRQPCIYLYASTSNTLSELIIESHKNATIIVLRSGCEQQRHTFFCRACEVTRHNRKVMESR